MRIWSLSPMPCEKHGPRASVTTKTSAFGLGLCLLSPSGHVFHTTRETMIKSYNMVFYGKGSLIYTLTSMDNKWCVYSSMRESQFVNMLLYIGLLFRGMVNLMSPNEACADWKNGLKDMLSTTWHQPTVQTAAVWSIRIHEMFHSNVVKMEVAISRSLIYQLYARCSFWTLNKLSTVYDTHLWIHPYVIGSNGDCFVSIRIDGSVHNYFHFLAKVYYNDTFLSGRELSNSLHFQQTSDYTCGNTTNHKTVCSGLSMLET